MLLRRILGLLLIALCAVGAAAQGVPAPKDFLGFTPGDDRKLASWSQIVGYFQKLQETSPRVKLESIGKSTLDRPFVYATISSPENLKNIARLRAINDQLADPRTIGRNDVRAKTLIRQGRAIVLLTFGIHSTEVGSTLSSMLIAHTLASSNDPKIKKILAETIVLIVPSLNPDGVDIVKNWYDKTLGTPYEGTNPPELYHHYIGHDNNRDWYLFSQAETKLTVDNIHNVWRPQIVHDVHQQGVLGARLFLPPYMAPVEPNVPRQIVEGYTELGNFMAEALRGDGFKGITTDTTYDAWTPARAYSHYHGGVRILSESASVRLATPVSVKFDELRGEVGGLNPKKESARFGPVWNGGDWRLSDITRQMTEGAFKLLGHSAENRERWLTRFYQIGKDATRPRGFREIFGFILPARNYSEGEKAGQEYYSRNKLVEILTRGGVKTEIIGGMQGNGKIYPLGSVFIPMAQPYGAFAKALLEVQRYPDLLDEKGEPIQPYDVTAHTLPLLMGVEVETLTEPMTIKKSEADAYTRNCRVKGNPGTKPGVWIYRSHVPSMDEGWTRFVFENADEDFNACSLRYSSATDSAIRDRDAYIGVKTIVFPDQSPSVILNGHRSGTMPEEFTGGIGKAGVDNLKKFVEDGGRLVFFNRASDFAIEQWGLPFKDVTDGIPNKQFFVPGSILRTEVETGHPIANGMPSRSIAWFENSPAFDATDSEKVSVIARYPTDPKRILLSGWAFGLDRIAGKAALVEVKMGRGSLVLFGFRPQYRAQSFATMPMIFNAVK